MKNYLVDLTLKHKSRISKKLASSKYGIITTGANSQYKYYLLDNGNIIDSDGDIRYMATKQAKKLNRAYEKYHDRLVGIAMSIIEEVFEVRENKNIDGEEYYLLEDEIIRVLKLNKVK